ncbi:MAG: LD-carboxypeptidase [Myxococcota bacterium]
MMPLIRKGAPIAVVAPCGVHDPARLARGLDIVRSFGHTIEVYPDLLQPVRYLASSDDHRVEQLSHALASRDHAAVWIARGGYGLTRILSRIDPATVTPKVVIGFSDVTALFARLHAVMSSSGMSSSGMSSSGGATLVHGPVVHSLPITDPGAIEHLFALLAGEDPEPMDAEVYVPGTASGPLIGGNLALLAALCGTPWQVDVRGAIVVIEEIGEAPYRIDRMLQQLIDAGGLAGAVGLAFGEFSGCEPPDGASWTLRDVLVDQVGRLGIPVIAGLPIGHGARNRPFRWGAPGAITASGLTFGA